MFFSCGFRIWQLELWKNKCSLQRMVIQEKHFVSSKQRVDRKGPRTVSKQSLRVETEQGRIPSGPSGYQAARPLAKQWGADSTDELITMWTAEKRGDTPPSHGFPFTPLKQRETWVSLFVRRDYWFLSNKEKPVPCSSIDHLFSGPTHPLTPVRCQLWTVVQDMGSSPP